MSETSPLRETPKAAHAYADYEAMGEERSLEKLAERYRKRTESASPGSEKPFAPSISTLRRWSQQHGWQKRLLQAEQEAVKKRRRRRQSELERMDEEQALVGRTQMLKLVRHMDDLIKAEKMGATATVTGIKIFSDMERVARGAATEIANMQVSGDAESPLVIKTIWDRALLELPAEPKQDDEGHNDGRAEQEPETEHE